MLAGGLCGGGEERVGTREARVEFLMERRNRLEYPLERRLWKRVLVAEWKSWMLEQMRKKRMS